MPVIVHFTDKDFLTIGAGFSYGRLVGVKEIEWGQQTNVTLNSGDFNRADICGLVDVRIPIYKRLAFDFRYSYSLLEIRDRTYTNISGQSWNRKQYNNVITMRLYYIFNERRPYAK